MVVLKDLINDLGSQFGAANVLPEYELIRLRSATRVNLRGLICAHHRYILGEGYRPSWKCSYLHHPSDSKSPGRKLKWILYQYVKTFQPNFVLGSLICAQCKKKLVQMMAEEPEDSIDNTDMDPDYVAPEPLVKETEKENRRIKMDELTDFFEIERIRHQICSVINTMSPNSINYFQRVYRELQNKLKNMFCSYVRPAEK